MVRNVSKPTFTDFGSGHKLNSKFVSEPCKKSDFVINMMPSNINISYNTILNT